MRRVLLVEDDASLGRTLAERLAREKVHVTWARTFDEAQAHLDDGHWDLAVLDVMLPDGSGFGLGRRLREQTTTPIMFMTALDAAEHRLHGLEIGAEEYLPKPFHLREFLIRVRHVLARRVPKLSIVWAGGMLIDFGAMSVKDAKGKTIFLQVRDGRVLKLLIESAPRVVDRSEILDRVWGEDRFPTSRAVDNVIVRLRHILKDHNGRLIRSVRGVGYQWRDGEDHAGPGSGCA